MISRPEDTTPRILVADQLAEAGIARLWDAGLVEVAIGLGEEQLAARIADFAALVVRSETKVTRRVIEAGTSLRVIGRAGVGVDNIDVQAATERGILVVNAPTGNTVAAAEHTIALMLALGRNVARADASLRAGRWERGGLVGTEMRGKTLAVIGLGKIGMEVARIAKGLQMRVVAFDPLISTERAEQLGMELGSFDDVLRQADVLTVHTPLNESTRGMIGERELALMPVGGRVLNVGRGGLISEEALARAVTSGHLAGAAVDVFVTEPPPPDHPLLGDPRILVTPHLGASTREAQVTVATDVAEQIVDVLAGKPARWAVNAPHVPDDELKLVVPYQDLGRRLGSIWAQMGGGALRAVELVYEGEVAGVHTGAISASVLSGMLGSFSHDRVTAVNAGEMALRHGVEVREQRTSKSGNFAGAIELRAEGRGPSSIQGALVLGQPRLVLLNEMRTDLLLEGSFLMLEHQDRPGLIGKIGQILGEADINIAEMQVGRDTPRGLAVTAIRVDEPISDAVMAELRATPYVQGVHRVEISTVG